MALELEREKERLRSEREYGSDRDGPGRRFDRQLEQQRDREWDTDVERSGQRSNRKNTNNNIMPDSPTPRRSYSPKQLAVGRHDTPLELGKPSTSSGHASSCGCYDCSAKMYGSRTTTAPSSASVASERDRDRDRDWDRQRDRADSYVGSSARYGSSQASLSLSKHPATSPLIGTSSRAPPQPRSLQSLAPPLEPPQALADPKPERRGVFANLRRLSMPLGGGGAQGELSNSRLSPAGKPDDARLTASLNANRR